MNPNNSLQPIPFSRMTNYQIAAISTLLAMANQQHQHTTHQQQVEQVQQMTNPNQTPVFQNPNYVNYIFTVTPATLFPNNNNPPPQAPPTRGDNPPSHVPTLHPASTPINTPDPYAHIDASLLESPHTSPSSPSQHMTTAQKTFDEADDEQMNTNGKWQLQWRRVRTILTGFMIC